jgi:hypothetical protein
MDLELCWPVQGYDAAGTALNDLTDFSCHRDTLLRGAAH